MLAILCFKLYVDEKNENMVFGMRIIGKKHFGSAYRSENDLGLHLAAFVIGYDAYGGGIKL